MKLDEKRLQKFKIFNNLGIDEIKVFLKKLIINHLKKMKLLCMKVIPVKHYYFFLMEK